MEFWAAEFGFETSQLRTPFISPQTRLGSSPRNSGLLPLANINPEALLANRRLGGGEKDNDSATVASPHLGKTVTTRSKRFLPRPRTATPEKGLGVRSSPGGQIGGPGRLIHEH